LCDRIALLDKGRIIACGSVGELRLTSRQDDRYWLKVRGLTEPTFQALHRVDGVVSCTRVSQTDEVVDLRIILRQNSRALAESLQHLVYQRAEILGCTLEEEQFEEVFRSLLQTVGPTPTPR